MSLELLVLAWLCAGGLVQAPVLLLSRRWPGAVHAVHLLCAFSMAAAALVGLQRARLDGGLFVLAGGGLPLGFWLEPLGAFAALLITLAGACCAVFAAGYARAAPGVRVERLAAAMALSVSAGACMALAGSLFTLTLAAPMMAAAAGLLTASAGGRRAGAAGYAVFRDFAVRAVLFLAPATVWVAVRQGQTLFSPAGMLGGIEPGEASVLLAALLIGVGGLSLRPLRAWPQAAALAPAPGAVLLMTGGLAIPIAAAALKVLRFGFADALVSVQALRLALLLLLGVSLIWSGLEMLRRETWRERLALLTWSQVALLLFGALLGSGGAFLGGVLQLGAAWASCLALGLAVAVVDAATGRDRPAQVRGLARRMPLTFLAFTVASLSASGAPPLAGGWARMWLAAGAAQAGLPVALAPMLLLSVCTFFAFGLPAARAAIDPAPEQPFSRPDGAAMLLVTPTAAAGACTVLFVFWVEPILARLQLISGGAG